MRFFPLFFLLLLPLHSQHNLQWKRALGGKVSQWQAEGPDGSIYTLSHDRALHRLNPVNGEDFWRFRPGGDLIDFLAVSPDGRIFIQNDRAEIFAVNPEGEALWRCYIGSHSTFLPLVSSEGTLILVLAEGSLVAISRSGELIWQVELNFQPGGSPILDNQQRIVLPREEGGMVLYDLDGEFLERRGRMVYEQLQLSTEGGILGITSLGRIFHWDSQGELLWDSATEPGEFSSVIEMDGQWYMQLKNGLIYQVNQQGAQGYYQGPAPMHPAIHTQEGDLLIIDVESILWRVNLNEEDQEAYELPCEVAMPLLTTRGNLILGGSDWKIYAYQWSSPAEGWSQFRGRSHRNGTLYQGYSFAQRREEFQNSRAYNYFQYIMDAEDSEMQEQLITKIDALDSWAELNDAYPFWDVMALHMAGRGVNQIVANQNSYLHSDPLVRAQAYRLLGKWELHSTRSRIIATLRSERDPLVLAEGYLALGRIGADWDGASCQVISQSLARQNNPTERQVLAAAEAYLMLLQWGGEEQSRRLIQALLDLMQSVPGGELRNSLDRMLDERILQSSSEGNGLEAGNH